MACPFGFVANVLDSDHDDKRVQIDDFVFTFDLRPFENLFSFSFFV